MTTRHDTLITVSEPCNDYAPDTLNPDPADRDICTSCFWRKADHDTTNPFTELLNAVVELDNDDAWTFMDQDPSVAWDDPESYHGRLAAIYEDAGWQSCYHRDGARFHFNVKVDSHSRYRGFHDALNAIRDSRGDSFNEPLFERIAEREENQEREAWWDNLSWAEDGDGMILRTKLTGDGWSKHTETWGCGRSGGYVNLPGIESDGEAMVRMAAWLAREVEGFNSYDAGKYAAEYVLELYDEERTMDLASGNACPNCGAVQ